MLRSILALVLIATVMHSETPAGVLDIISIDFAGAVTRADFDTGAVVYSTPGDNSAQGFGGLAKTSDGRFLAFRQAMDGNPAALFEIDPTTGSKMLLSNSLTGPTSTVATTFTLDGRLINYANGPVAGFHVVDQNTLASTPLNLTFSNSPFNYSSGSLATAPDGSLYTWLNGNTLQNSIFTPFSSLFRIDLTTNTATAISASAGAGAPTALINSMAFDPNGNLYAFTEINSNNNGNPLQANSIFAVNTQTGELTYVNSFDFLAGMRGVEFVTSVPEPASFSLIGVVVCVAAGYRRMRRSSSRLANS